VNTNDATICQLPDEATCSQTSPCGATCAAAEAWPRKLFGYVLTTGYQVHVGKLGERQVDFVADKDGEREYFQVAYRLLDRNTIDRELSVLEAIPDNFPKTVLSLDRIAVKRNGIHHRYLPEWLLGRLAGHRLT